MNIFIPVEFFFIVSQDCCESRDIIYDERANSVLSVFKLLINKKRVDGFYKWLSLSISCHAGGARLFCNWKSYLQMEK